MKVHPSHAGEVTSAHVHGQAAAKLASTSSATASFAGVLAEQSGTATAGVKAVTLRKGETMRPVDGHSYGEIDGGKRDGMYVNTTSNKRRGQAFVLVHRHGREYHIYGTGKDRVVVALRKREADADTPRTTTAPNTAVSTGGVTPTVSAS